MRTTTLSTGMLVAVALIALSIGACQSPGSGSGTDGPGSKGAEAQMPVAGTTYLGGKLVLESVSIPTAGGQPATFVLKNTSAEDLDDLTARVIFFFPPTDNFSEFSTEKVEDLFKVYRNDEHTISVTPSSAEELRHVEFDVTSGQMSLQATVTREGASPGSRLLGGMLECVGVEDNLTFEHPTITFVVENVSSETVSMFEYQIVLRKQGVVLTQTEWQFVDQEIAPGRRASLKADMGGQDVGYAESILRIRRPEL
jgi:hypothetical protein